VRYHYAGTATLNICNTVVALKQRPGATVEAEKRGGIHG
jgi:hypothetical protein